MVKASHDSWLRQRLWLYVLFIVIGSIFRLWLISSNNVLFWFDQARDAIIVQEMVQNRDLKIQGPSASGTSDTIYHGVLYFYLIAPLYAVAQGNPQIVSGILGVISMLAIVPLGELSWALFRSKKSFVLTVLLFALSTDAAQMGAWLSNPMLATVTIPFFFYFLYRVFWLQKSQELWLVALFLGLSHQAVIFSAYLFGVIALAWWLQKSAKNDLKFTRKSLVIAAGIYLATVATMIVAQLLLFYRGVFKPAEAFSQISDVVVAISTAVPGIIKNYLEVIGNAYFPSKPVLSIIFFIVIVWFVMKKFKSSHKSFFFLVLLSPLFLTSWQYRNSYHTLIGIAPLLYVFSGQILVQMKEKLYLGTFIVYGIVTIFIFSNMQQLLYSNTTGQHPVAVQIGTTLRDKLNLIDYTYAQAAGQPFTISSFTSPYNYNTTWSYLYSWYGQEKYAYTPTFVGPDQNGLFGGDMLQKADTPSELHFALYEPSHGIPEWLYIEFVAKQNQISALVEEMEFGSMLVEKRVPVVTEAEPVLEK